MYFIILKNYKRLKSVETEDISINNEKCMNTHNFNIDNAIRISFSCKLYLMYKYSSTAM